MNTDFRTNQKQLVSKLKGLCSYQGWWFPHQTQHLLLNPLRVNFQSVVHELVGVSLPHQNCAIVQHLFRKLYPLGLFSGIGCCTFHSLTEFSFSLPPFSLLVACVLLLYCLVLLHDVLWQCLETDSFLC